MLELNGLKAVGPKIQNIKRQMKGTSSKDWSLVMNRLRELFDQEEMIVTTEISNKEFTIIPVEGSSGDKQENFINLSVNCKFKDMKSGAFITAPMVGQGIGRNKKEAVLHALDNANRWYFSMLFDLPFREKITD